MFKLMGKEIYAILGARRIFIWIYVLLKDINILCITIFLKKISVKSGGEGVGNESFAR